MSDTPRIAALIYDESQDPDALLRGFAADLNGRGMRAVGLVQLGDPLADPPQLSALLLHSNETMRLFQDLGRGSTGCKLDVGQLLAAGTLVAKAIDDGADLVIINRFGRQEIEGKGLSYLIERALSAEIPVVIAVPEARLAAWKMFSDGMAVQLTCDRAALDGWWSAVAADAEPALSA
ncbi:MAG: DUF2478 domain-containing protein [Tardiphaga sp.]|uniref:DUF2478 domain-containing protein n=1 Tax=Tardiphaga sp. TaxID=1926292 RepID=UPI0019B96AF1|nr:DUF2478 domain-containing protein [Tardiphaga sp.]MBC7584156.1 DUF2478 domain-containing protein [Tardiphaga sp.]